ncbi:MAG: hypothetical protein NC396_08510 [Bacteroides sp.]|nr:hypothetical protein [Bacteroides sp.]MCM1085103.1 hypothetical protein [Bacteroides sp.]
MNITNLIQDTQIKMCLYPKLILNPKYIANKKNGGKPAPISDIRVKYVPVGCGNCIECKRQLARAWQVRLSEEIKDSQGIFVTLSFAPEELEKLCKEFDVEECNAIATIAVRRFLERYRKKYKTSVKHWLITELGHQNTERIHLHGIIFKKMANEELQELWKYGNTYTGDYCNQKTINYVVKYVTKVDEKHKDYKQKILCSPGIGRKYMERPDKNRKIFKGEDTEETYDLPNGNKVNLPIYYRNKIYSENEREKLWLQKLDKQERYVMGERIDVSTDEGENEYWSVLKEAQKKNERMKYGDDSKAWKKKDYNITLRMLKRARHLDARNDRPKK